MSRTTSIKQELPRRIGFWGGSAVMVGIIIGSGIFRTPTNIAGQLGKPWLILALWALGGLLALFGALTYAELATMFPRSGGVYIFLREGYGRWMAFVFGWTYLLISKPLAAAGIAVVFTEHLNQLLGTDWDKRWVTCGALLALTIVNTFQVQVGAGVAGIFTAMKVLALAAIVLIALALRQGSAANFASVADPRPLHLAIVAVMTSIMWAYDGWSDVGSIAGEIRTPQRLLPRTFLIGTAAVALLYVAVNAVYLWMLPLAEMSRVAHLAPLVMSRLLGDAGGVAAAMIVIISTLGATHGSILTGARVTFAQARDGLLFRFLGRIHPRFRTPAVSLWFQLILSCAAMIIYEEFDQLAGGFVFTMWIFYGLAAASVIILRIRRPDAERPYRCWGYPVVPAVFVLAAAAMTVMAIWESPRNTLIWLAVLAGGIPIYFAWSALVPQPGDPAVACCRACGHELSDVDTVRCSQCGAAIQEAVP